MNEKPPSQTPPPTLPKSPTGITGLENARELTDNVRSLGFDLDQLVARKKIVLDHVHIERSEIEETGEYDFEGLFIRLGHAIDTIGAKRVVLDTVESLFGGLPKHAILPSDHARRPRVLLKKQKSSCRRLPL